MNASEKEMLVLLPSNRQGELLKEEGHNRLGVLEALQHLGFQTVFLDVHNKPWNPFAGRPALFASIDPLRALRVLAAKRKASAVISYYQSGALLILALRKWLGFKPLVAIIDIGDDVGWRIRARMVEYCIHRADVVFTFASDQAEYLRQKYRTNRVLFLMQQVDTEFFCPGENREGDYILSVGSDVSRDYECLKTATEGLDVPVVLRTDIVKADPLAQPNLRVIAERQSDGGLRELYRSAKIFVLPLKDTIHPGGITALLEAFACGKAVIASQSRGIRDYLHDGENCLMVPSENPEALQAAIVRLLEDTELRVRLGRNARAYAAAELSQKRHAQRLVTALRALGAE